MQTHLRRRAFDGVHRSKQPVDIVRIGIALESEQAFGDGLQVLFGFGDEKFEDFIGHFVIRGKPVNEGRPREDGWDGFARTGSLRDRLIGRFRDGRGRKRKCVPLAESGEIARCLRSAGTDLQEIELEDGNRVGEEFSERAVHVRGERRIHRVVKNMRHLGRDLGELRKAITRRGARERV